MKHLLFLSLLATVACTGAQDDPSSVRDMRVLGMSFEPSELLFPCDQKLLLALLSSGTDAGIQIDAATQTRLFLFAGRPLDFNALIGNSNDDTLNYKLRACVARSDRECDNEASFIELGKGETTRGNLNLKVTPGSGLLGDGTPILLETVAQDSVRGLGGIRMPVVLDLENKKTGERIVAQKLMVYSCQFFREQKQNITPVVSGLKFKDDEWTPTPIPSVTGKDEVSISPSDFSMLQEDYIVPSFQLKPINLKESWKVSWYVSSGTMSPNTTGGTDATGAESRQLTKWKPDPKETNAQDITLQAVVRDGRGGQSWLTRKFKWTP
jgi:hypothetical protein